MTTPGIRFRDRSHANDSTVLQQPLRDIVESPGTDDATSALDALTHYSNTATEIRHTADVHIFKLMNQPYVMKFHRPRDRTHIRAWASSVLCGVLFGKFPHPKRLLPGGIHHEAQRLRTLRKHGVRVPKVHVVTRDHLILEHSGESLESILKTLPANNQRTELLWAVVDDLIEFHRAGHWHGGAQIRNLTLKDDLIYRIDFEEQIGTAFPLPFAQAFDVLLAFNSMVDHLHGDTQEFGTKLLTHYLDSTASAPLIKTLNRLNRLLRHFRRLEPHLHQRLRQKSDIQRTHKFASILHHALHSHGGAPRQISTSGG